MVDRVRDSGLHVSARLVREGVTGSALRVPLVGCLVRLIAFLGTCHGARLREVGRPTRPDPVAAHEWELRQRMQPSGRVGDAARPGAAVHEATASPVGYAREGVEWTAAISIGLLVWISV